MEGVIEFIENNQILITAISVIIALLALLFGTGWISGIFNKKRKKREQREKESKERAMKLLESIKIEKSNFTYMTSYKGPGAFKHFKYAIVRTINAFFKDPDKVVSEIERILKDERHVSRFKINLITEFVNTVKGLKRKEDRQNLMNLFNSDLTDDERLYFFCLIKYKERNIELLNNISSSIYLDDEIKSFVLEELIRTKGNFLDFTPETARENIKKVFVKLNEYNG